MVWSFLLLRMARLGVVTEYLHYGALLLCLRDPPPTPSGHCALWMSQRAQGWCIPRDAIVLSQAVLLGGSPKVTVYGARA